MLAGACVLPSPPASPQADRRNPRPPAEANGLVKGKVGEPLANPPLRPGEGPVRWNSFNSFEGIGQQPLEGG